MLRMRRYRIVLALAILIVVGIYYINDLQSWRSVEQTLDRLAVQKLTGPKADTREGNRKIKTPDDPFHNHRKQDTAPVNDFPQIQLPGEEPQAPSNPEAESPSTSTTTGTNQKVTEYPGSVGDESTKPHDSPFADSQKDQVNRPAASKLSSTAAAPFPPSPLTTVSKLQPTHTTWFKQPEFFPVASESIIPLPTAIPKHIPRVQYSFRRETAIDRKAREKRTDAIKDAFLRHWNGYKRFAWEHDELKPLSGGYGDPFAGWRATLVDSLDTLWIMGLKEEFEEAVNETSNIDFTTTSRYNLPLFEVVIRYLGGLLAAYDVSEHQYPVLLKKATQLGEMLYGAFDTPNRMPMLSFQWQPMYAMKPRAAGNGVVLAELGSLSLEFTRLAQLTGDDKFYDAVARVTNALDEFQGGTKVPGLWPLSLDSSGGCNGYILQREYTEALEPKVEPVANTPPVFERPVESYGHITSSFTEGKTDSTSSKSPQLPAPLNGKKDESTFGNDRLIDTLSKRDPDDLEPRASHVLEKEADSLNRSITENLRQCWEYGLSSQTIGGFEKFSLGAQADSTYEYLPKEYLLVGGHEQQYQRMYERFMHATENHLIYKPMIEDQDRKLLFTGSLSSNGERDEITGHTKATLTPSFSHLTCFIGAVVGLGAKIFERERDLEIAKRLTDGCVWAYEQTTTGIMPEEFQLVACDNPRGPCPFNETKWWDVIDPNAAARIQNNQKTIEDRKKAEEARLASIAELAQPARPTLLDVEDSTEVGFAELQAVPAAPVPPPSLQKRQMDARPDVTPADISEDLSYKPLERKPKTPVDPSDVNAPPSALEKDNADTDSAAKKLLHDTDSSIEAFKKIIDQKKKHYEMEDKVLHGQADQNIAGAGSGSSAPLLSGSMQSQALAAGFDNAQPPTGTIGRIPAAPNPAMQNLPSTTTSKFPDLPTTLPDYFAKTVYDRRLPPGFTKMNDRRYLLRPEAIESVFYMYRITGDPVWREKGWRMFESVELATYTKYGNSAILDVMAPKDQVPMADQAESFWTAETLKYFYMLWAEESLVSLDDWVLNTEAHPFRRPDAQPWPPARKGGARSSH